MKKWLDNILKGIYTMTNVLLFSILIVLSMGIWLIQRKLSQIKKIRELNNEDMNYIKEIISFIARKNGFETYNED